MPPLSRRFVRTINRVLTKIGPYTLSKERTGVLERTDPDIPLEAVRPSASYAPWLDDEKFNSVYRLAKQNTLVDHYRLYELYSLVQQLKPLEGAMLEVGVWRGGSSAIIQKALLESGQSGRPFFIADTFEGVVKGGHEKDTFYRGGEHADTCEELVRQLFSQARLPLPTILKGIFPDDHADAINGKICFLHSDVDAYQSTSDIIDWVMPRLCEKAILVFDDYGFSTCSGVTKFCNELRSNTAFYFVHNLNGHAIFIKK